MSKMTFARARAVCRKIAKAGMGVYPCIESFGTLGVYKLGLVQEARVADKQKAVWKCKGQISTELYWGIVELERFISDQADDHFTKLKTYSAIRERELQALAA